MSSTIMPWTARFRYGIVVLWLLLVVAAVPFAANVTHHLTSRGFENPSSRAVWADHQLTKLRPPASIPPTLIRSRPWSIIRSDAAKAGLDPAWLYRVQSHAALLLVPANAPIRPMTTFRRMIQQGGGQVETVNTAHIGQQISREAENTLKSSATLALPLVAVLLLLVFGTVASAILPLLIAAVGSVLSLAIIDLLESQVTLSIYLTDIVSLLALGVGVDYALFISARFRQGLARGLSTPRAVQEAMATAGRSVFFSGLAVALAVSTLVLGGTAYWRGLAIGGAVAVAAVLIATHTLLPAVLSMMGSCINWGRVPLGGRLGTFWSTIGRFSTRQALPIAIGLVVLVIPGLYAPQAHMQTPANVASMLPASSVLRQASQKEQQVKGPGSIASIPVVLRLSTTVSNPQTWIGVGRLIRRIKQLPSVESVASPIPSAMPPAAMAHLASLPLGPSSPSKALGAFINPAQDPHLVAVFVTSRWGPDSPHTIALTAQLQQTAHQVLPKGSVAGVGGATSVLHSFNQLTASRLPAMVGAVALVAFVILTLATGSLPQALIGVILDGLVALATAGILVLTVQRGGLGLEPEALDSSITPLIFVLLFGLSMDYEVILLHRIQEYMHKGMTAQAAAQKGIAMTGSMITGAGLLIVVVFAALITSKLEIMQALGIGLTTAILLDTWVVRTFLVPSSVALWGRFAFWPWGMKSPPPDSSPSSEPWG